MDVFWEAIRLNICRVCGEADQYGNCLLPAMETCALKVFLPELVAVVSTNQKRTHETYLEVLRGTICAKCDHQLSQGVCRKRRTLDCTLDRYYPTIIEIIRTVKAEAE